jgi:hypothetical protein
MQTLPRAPHVRAEAAVEHARAHTAPALTLLPSAEPVSLNTLRVRWRIALDAAQEALRCSGGSWSTAMPAAEVNERTRRLAREREDVTQLLQAIARLEHVKPVPPLTQRSLERSRRSIRRIGEERGADIRRTPHTRSAPPPMPSSRRGQRVEV